MAKTLPARLFGPLRMGPTMSGKKRGPVTDGTDPSSRQQPRTAAPPTFVTNPGWALRPPLARLNQFSSAAAPRPVGPETLANQQTSLLAEGEPMFGKSRKGIAVDDIGLAVCANRRRTAVWAFGGPRPRTAPQVRPQGTTLA